MGTIAVGVAPVGSAAGANGGGTAEGRWRMSNTAAIAAVAAIVAAGTAAAAAPVPFSTAFSTHESQGWEKKKKKEGDDTSI